jgi:hypothetical protein
VATGCQTANHEDVGDSSLTPPAAPWQPTRADPATSNRAAVPGFRHANPWQAFYFDADGLLQVAVAGDAGNPTQATRARRRGSVRQFVANAGSVCAPAQELSRRPEGASTRPVDEVMAVRGALFQPRMECLPLLLLPQLRQGVECQTSGLRSPIIVGSSSETVG